MKQLFLLFPLLFLININPAAAQISSPWAQQMSADQVINLPDGQAVTNRIYIDHGRARFDMKVAGIEITSIMLLDKKIMYSLMPAQKMAIETSMNANDEDRLMAFDQKNIKFEPVGQGTLDGIECDKYRLLFATGRNQIFWINRQTRVPMQMEAEDGTMKVIWKNVIIGPQPESLFVLPADYKVTRAAARI